MKLIKINEVAYYVPTKYNDLSVKQLRQVCKLQLENTPKNQLNVLWYLLNLKWWKLSDYKKWNTIRTLPAEWLHTLLSDKSLFGWIFSQSNLTEYKLPSFRVGFKRYFGPADHILNISAVEVTFAYDFFRRYSETKNIRYLDLLIAVLYREKDKHWRKNILKYGYNGDVRVQLNPFLLNDRLKQLSKIPVETKVIIFLMFAGKWAEFEKKEEYKIIFPSGSTDEKAIKKPDPLMWQKIMMEIAKSGVFGEMEKVEKIPMDRFFLYMVKNMEDYLAMKDKLNSKK